MCSGTRQPEVLADCKEKQRNGQLVHEPHSGALLSPWPRCRATPRVFSLFPAAPSVCCTWGKANKVTRRRGAQRCWTSKDRLLGPRTRRAGNNTATVNRMRTREPTNPRTQPPSARGPGGVVLPRVRGRYDLRGLLPPIGAHLRDRFNGGRQNLSTLRRVSLGRMIITGKDTHETSLDNRRW